MVDLHFDTHLVSPIAKAGAVPRIREMLESWANRGRAFQGVATMICRPDILVDRG